MEEYEYQAIIQYQGYGIGYNQTLNTHNNNICHENCKKYISKISCKCAKVDKNNNIIEIYSSYHEAARKNNLDGDSSASKVRAICKGKNSSIKDELIFRDLDKDGKVIEKPFKSYKNRKTLIGIDINNPDDIVYFPSITAAAQELHTERKSIQQCIQGSDRYSKVKGYIFREIDFNGDILETEKTIEDRLEEYNLTNPLIDSTFWYYFVPNIPLLIISIMSCTPLFKNIFSKHIVLNYIFLMLGLVLSTSFLIDSTFNPFLYFRF
jgi:hypothetical protein